MTPFDDGSRHLVERANKSSWIRSLKGGQIRALEDGQGMGIVSSEGEKGRVIPHRDISLGGVKIPTTSYLLPGSGERTKILELTIDAAAEAGGGAAAAGAGGGKSAGGRRKIFRRIHNIRVFFVDVSGERNTMPSRQ